MVDGYLLMVTTRHVLRKLIFQFFIGMRIKFYVRNSPSVCFDRTTFPTAYGGEENFDFMQLSISMMDIWYLSFVPQMTKVCRGKFAIKLFYANWLGDAIRASTSRFELNRRYKWTPLWLQGWGSHGSCSSSVAMQRTRIRTSLQYFWGFLMQIDDPRPTALEFII